MISIISLGTLFGMICVMVFVMLCDIDIKDKTFHIILSTMVIVFMIFFISLAFGLLHENDFKPTDEFRIQNVNGEYVVERKYKEVLTFWDGVLTSEWRFYSKDLDIQNAIESILVDK